MKRQSEHLSFEKVWRLFQESDKRLKETERLLNEKFQETDKKLRQLESLFTGQWGKLVESLVAGNWAQILRERGIDVEGTSQREHKFYNGREYEIDIIAKNGKDIVPVEVKTTLKKEHTGSVAFLRVEEEADKYAYRKGLFVIKATGESAKILKTKNLNLKNGK